jgi:hypothetical protein
MRSATFAVTLATLLVVVSACGGGGGSTTPTPPPPPPVKPLTKLALNGTRFVDAVSRAPVQLKGVAFASGVWLWTAENPDAASLPNVAFMQGESDFARVAGWGANVVTLYFSYDWFKTPSSDGWAWLDQTLDWADKYGFYVIPSLVVYPVGGLRGGAAFWASAPAKSDVLAMWQAFATRYKGRKEIVGLDVLNEPQGTDIPTIVAYQAQLVDAVRAVDPGAIVFIEPMWGDAGNLQSIARDDLVYVSHYYEPMYYTGQGYYWISNGNVPVGTGYPGEMVMWTSSATASWADVNPMRSGTSAWTQVQEDPVTVASSFTQVVYPYLAGYSTDASVEIDIDDVEYAVLSGGLGSPSWHPVLNGDFEQTNDDAFHWNITAPANVQRVKDAATGNWYLKMQGCNVVPNPCTVALTDFWVGTLGGIPVTGGDQIAFRFRLRVPTGSGLGGVGAIYAYNVAKYWDKAAIQNSVLSKLVDFSTVNKAPMFVGEFTPSLVAPTDSKIAYTTDLIDVLNQNGLSWTFYVYRENWPVERRLLGLYNGPVGTPTSGCVEESELIDVLKAGYK